MLNFFYKYTLIVSRTTNINIYLKFRIFDAMFNYLEHLKKTIEINVCFLIEIVTKLAKYCLKTKEFDNTLSISKQNTRLNSKSIFDIITI